MNEAEQLRNLFNSAGFIAFALALVSDLALLLVLAVMHRRLRQRGAGRASRLPWGVLLLNLFPLASIAWGGVRCAAIATQAGRCWSFFVTANFVVVVPFALVPQLALLFYLWRRVRNHSMHP